MRRNYGKGVVGDQGVWEREMIVAYDACLAEGETSLCVIFLCCIP
jgi:hypothetical protein